MLFRHIQPTRTAARIQSQVGVASDLRLFAFLAPSERITAAAAGPGAFQGPGDVSNI